MYTILAVLRYHIIRLHTTALEHGRNYLARTDHGLFHHYKLLLMGCLGISGERSKPPRE